MCWSAPGGDFPQVGAGLRWVSRKKGGDKGVWVARCSAEDSAQLSPRARGGCRDRSRPGPAVRHGCGMYVNGMTYSGGKGDTFRERFPAGVATGP